MSKTSYVYPNGFYIICNKYMVNINHISLILILTYIEIEISEVLITFNIEFFLSIH